MFTAVSIDVSAKRAIARKSANDRTQSIQRTRRRRSRWAEGQAPFLLRRLCRFRANRLGLAARLERRRDRAQHGLPAPTRARTWKSSPMSVRAVTDKDILGNEGRTEVGDVQVMSAGAGIRHAEYNLADARCGLRAILPAGPVTRCDGQHSGLVRRWR